MPGDLLSIPFQAGRAIIETGSVVACPLLGTDRFVTFCKERGLSVESERLLRLELLGLFAPIFRVRNPEVDVPAFTIPLRDEQNWFETGWAWDTTNAESLHHIPDPEDRTQEGYYSIFQIDHLDPVLSAMTLQVHLDSYLAFTADSDVHWEEIGRGWLQYAKTVKASFHSHEQRRSTALLCQFISDRYYPQTQGDQRTLQLSNGSYSDRWIRVYAPDWDWHQLALEPTHRRTIVPAYTGKAS